MCGIAGYYAFGTKLPDKDSITKMFVETQSRGKDAAGYAYINKFGDLVVSKQPGPATNFVHTDEWTDLELPKILMLHCRQGTQGGADDNKNNHPVFTKSGWALIHNGFIRNDNTLFDKLPIERDGKVDSEILVKLLELGGNWDEGMEQINTVRGSLACAAIYKGQPDDLLLFRNNNPIVFAYDQDTDILYFGSTKDIVLKGCSIPLTLRGFLFNRQPSNITIWDMPKDIGYLITSKGMTKEWDISDTDSSSWSTDISPYKGNSYFPPRYDKDKGETCSACGKKSLKSYAYINSKIVCHTCRIRS